MGIKSTQYITRDSCIRRIKKIDYLIFHRKYRDIEQTTSEYDYNLQDWVNETRPLLLQEQEGDLEDWTDEMLEDKMDEPFYRFSMFDNYLISEGETREVGLL